MATAVKEKGHDVAGLSIAPLGEQLEKFIKQIEALEEEKAEISTAIKEAFAEAKGEGLDTPDTQARNTDILKGYSGEARPVGFLSLLIY